MKPKNNTCEHVWVYKILFNHTGVNICEKCKLIQPQYKKNIKNK